MYLPGPREWSGNQQVNQYLFALSSQFKQCLPYNADRVSLLLACSAAGATIWVAFESGLVVPNGIPFTTTLPPLVLSFSQHGDIVKQPVYAVFPGGSGSLYAVETIWLPQTSE